MEAALDCVIVMDESANVIAFNPSAEQTFGYMQEEAIGRPLSELIIPPELREAHRVGLRRFLRTKVPHVIGRRIEVPAIRKDGSQLLVELAITSTNAATGWEFTGYLRDITATKTAQEAIEHLLHDQEQILTAVGEGIIRSDPDQVVTFVNPTASRLLKYEPDEMIGKHLHYLIHDRRPDGSPFPLEECFVADTLQTGRTHRIDTDVFWAKDGSSIPVDFISSPIREGAKLVGGAISFRDITKRKQIERDLEEARDRFAFLARTAEVLSSTLDPESALQLLAEAVVPHIADWCSIDVLDGGRLRRVALHHIDPGQLLLAKELERRYPARDRQDRPSWQVMQTGKPLLMSTITEEILQQSARDEEHLALLRKLRAKSVYLLPLLSTDHRPLGVITIISAESGRIFDEEDLQFGMEIARRAAVALQNAMLFRERNLVANTLQQSLLPPMLPTIPDVELGARYVAGAEGMEVGGDFYDLFPVGEDEWGVVMGDVCGKGAPAAAMTALARYTIRAAATQARRPARVLSRVNDAIIAQATGERFCTVAYLRLRPDAQTALATIALGGHPMPFVLRSDGTVERFGLSGTALGISEGPRLTDATLSIEPHDTIVLYTDGVVDSLDRDNEAGERMFAEALSEMRGLSPDEIASKIEQLALSRSGGGTRDDMAILALRFSPQRQPVRPAR
ncbi:MAG: SpoIIE family protein phosphatase [Actinomycetota bacterium]